MDLDYLVTKRENGYEFRLYFVSPNEGDIIFKGDFRSMSENSLPLFVYSLIDRKGESILTFNYKYWNVNPDPRNEDHWFRSSFSNKERSFNNSWESLIKIISPRGKKIWITIIRF